MPQALRAGANYEASPDFPEEMTRPERSPEDEQRDDREAKLERLQAFSAIITKLRDEWIAARRATGWDRRVQEDLDQYHARESGVGDPADMMSSVQAGGPVTQANAGDRKAATRSRVFIGLTRQKSNAGEARLADILLPTDEKNWGIRPTPVPELAQMALDGSPAVDPETGGPMVLNAADPTTGEMRPTQVKKSDIALAAEQVARGKAKEMEKEIEDQLVECDYNGHSRSLIHNAAVMGTGVLRGPVPFNKTRRSWTAVQGGVYQLVEIEEQKPASISVDPRYVWEDPDCGDDIQNGRGIIELEQKTKRQVRDLAKQPGFIREALAKVLEEGPKRSGAMVDVAKDTERKLYQKNSYDVWLYTGEIERAELRNAELLSGARDAETAEDEEEDPFETVSACVVVINDTVVKAYPNPIETGELPYDFFPWELVADSPRGYGVPYLMRAPQKVINAAWRMMLDNASVCAGPQIIMRKGKVEPEDGTYQLYARKVWLYTGEDGGSLNDVFGQVEFNMHQAEFANIIKLGVELADAETSTPMIAQGEQGSAPETVGGMQLLLNSSNVVLRRLVKQYDDRITRRHIRRYYDYNMAYSDKDAIKGDFSVDARGSSALLVRDIQNQAFTNLLAAGANPVYAKFIDEKKLFEKALAAQHIQPQDIMKTDAQIKQAEELQKAAPPDPRIAAAEITANARLQEAETNAASDQSEIELRREIALQNHASQVAKLELERDIAMLKYATEQKLTLEQAKVQLATVAMNNRQKNEQLQTEATLRRETGEGI